ncbi:MAG: type II toxin-antitoxin system RatA family toxin [Armatimonadota bacterium]
MASYSHSVPVSAAPEELWALVHDVRRVADLFPFTHVEDISSPETDCWLYWRQLTIPNVVSLRWREQAWVSGDSRMQFKAVEGDLETFTGEWLVVTADEGAKLTLSLEYEIPESTGIKLPAAMVNYAMGEIFKTICQRMRQAVEEGDG